MKEKKHFKQRNKSLLHFHFLKTVIRKKTTKLWQPKKIFQAKKIILWIYLFP